LSYMIKNIYDLFNLKILEYINGCASKFRHKKKLL